MKTLLTLMIGFYFFSSSFISAEPGALHAQWCMDSAHKYIFQQSMRSGNCASRVSSFGGYRQDELARLAVGDACSGNFDAAIEKLLVCQCHNYASQADINGDRDATLMWLQSIGRARGIAGCVAAPPSGAQPVVNPAEQEPASSSEPYVVAAKVYCSDDGGPSHDNFGKGSLEMSASSAFSCDNALEKLGAFIGASDLCLGAQSNWRMTDFEYLNTGSCTVR